MNPAVRDRRVAAFIAAVVAALCVYAVRQVDPDLYGYLVYGRLFDQNDGPVSVDPFGYTSSGTPWVAFEYLAQWSLWRAYDAFGPVGLIGWKCVLGGLAMLGMWRAVRVATDDPLVSLPAFLLCAVPLARYFLFRPQVVTFACFAWFVAALVRYLTGRPVRLWVLPLVMVPWANAHGGFVAGLGAIGLTGLLVIAQNVAARTSRPLARVGRLAATFAACCAATFVTPFGTDLWRYVLTELTHDTNRRYIAEWRPPNWTLDPWSVIALAILTVALVAATAGATRGRRRVHALPPWIWMLSCAPLLVMSMTSVRHLPLAAIWCAPIVALLGTAAWTPRPSRAFAAAWLGIGIASAVPVLAASQYVAHAPAPVVAADGTLLGSTNPCRIVTAMAEQGLRGNVYAPLWWGGYLTWRLYPDVRVVVDGRNITAFPRATVLDNLKFYTEPDADAADVPLQYDTDWLLIPTDARALPVVRQSAAWREVFVDDAAVLFARAERRLAPTSLAPPRAACADRLQ